MRALTCPALALSSVAFAALAACGPSPQGDDDDGDGDGGGTGSGVDATADLTDADLNDSSCGAQNTPIAVENCRRSMAHLPENGAHSHPNWH
jgi:hypothetical protein